MRGTRISVDYANHRFAFELPAVEQTSGHLQRPLRWSGEPRLHEDAVELGRELRNAVAVIVGRCGNDDAGNSSWAARRAQSNRVHIDGRRAGLTVRELDIDREV